MNRRLFAIALLLGGLAATANVVRGRRVPGDASRINGDLARAEAARDDLFATLSGELKAAIKAGGAASAIGVCAERAPAIAVEVSEEHGLRIGRTSRRLRSPANGAPDWAAAHVNKGLPEPATNRAADGTLQALFPIRIAPLCLQCHGEPDALAAGVGEALTEAYRGDQATSYAPGDLRGWFWVEVPPGP